MQRLIYDLDARAVVAIIDPCEGTATGTPHFTFEGTASEVAAKIAELSGEAAAVPSSISARQIRLWLVRNGIGLAAVEAAIDGIEDATARDSVRVEWEYAPYIERSHEMLIPLAAALGLNAEQIDEAFREAATL